MTRPAYVCPACRNRTIARGSVCAFCGWTDGGAFLLRWLYSLGFEDGHTGGGCQSTILEAGTRTIYVGSGKDADWPLSAGDTHAEIEVFDDSKGAPTFHFHGKVCDAYGVIRTLLRNNGRAHRVNSYTCRVIRRITEKSEDFSVEASSEEEAYERAVEHVGSGAVTWVTQEDCDADYDYIIDIDDQGARP